MVEIVIVYASCNRGMARALHAILSEHWQVWYDGLMAAGNYRPEVERRIAQAKCVIPLWCRVSREDDDVIDEAQLAKTKCITLLPVRLEDVDPPLGFRGMQYVDLLGWDGGGDNPGINDLVAKLKQIVPSVPRMLARTQSLTLGEKSVSLPTLFQSVSSHETQLQPQAAISALSLFGSKAVLVSAYDFKKRRGEGGDAQSRREDMVADLRRLREAGSLVLLDSGNYEALRKRDTSWKAKDLHATFRTVPHDLAFSFDDMAPPSDAEGIARQVLDAVEREREHAQASAPLASRHEARGRVTVRYRR